MKQFLQYYINSLRNYSQSLSKKSILISKPWALVDNDGEIQKLIFEKDGGLVLSKNGKVTEGSWKYYLEARSLKIDRRTDILLLNEQFIDENVLILKKDGTDNEFFALANENELPDYDVVNYLKSINSELFVTSKYNLLNGKVMLVDAKAGAGGYLIDAAVCFLNDQGVPEKMPDGEYLTDDKRLTVVVLKQRIKSIIRNKVFESPDGISYEIRNNDYASLPHEDYTDTLTLHERFVNHKLTINGNPVEKNCVVVDENTVYKIESSIIVQVLFIREYRLTHDFNIKVEHRDDPSFKKGDLIISSDPVHPIPDGKYRVKGKLKWIRVKDGVIV